MLPYAELHCKTNFSFLEGASHAEELFRRAAELDYYAISVTDRQSLAGMVRAHRAARDVGLKLIVGAQVDPLDAPSVILWVTDRASYAQLCRLITVGRRRAMKGECELYFADIAKHHLGLLAGLLPYSRASFDPHENAAPPGSVRLAAPAELQPYRDLFGDRAHLLAALHHGPDDQETLQKLQRLAWMLRLPLVASGDVYYHVPERLLLYDVLTAIRQGTSVAHVQQRRFANAERHLRSREAIGRLFSSCPDAIERTTAIADRCRFSLDQLRYEYPEELAPANKTPLEFLKELTWQGANWRYPQGVPTAVCRQLDHELQLIEDLQYEAYFLTVWDLVRFARRRGILCQGRGSAANSAVCYCLGVTAVDPDRTDLLFERFISRERNEAPDIDVDFEHERREEVLQYIYDKYGRDRAGMTAEVICYRLRSAIRDSGKALGMSLDRVDALAKQVEGYAHDDKLVERFRQAGVDPESPSGKQWLEVVQTLTGFPRHLSQHVGGMVITRGPLCELVPIENAAMEGRTVICWDKDDLDELGILKVDCLGLGMLTAIRKCFELLSQHLRGEWTLASIPAEEPQTYDMICRADTIGLFQIESRAQMSMLPRLRPRCFYDLVIEVAIVRPGPIQGQMVHPYLRRRRGVEPVTYANDEIRRVLEKTLGVPIFQEQAMKLAVVAAGFSPGEADQLRRAMGAWRKTGAIDQFRVRLLNGMRQRGLSDEFAEQLFRQLRGFGEYGFPESHAASFALLVYVSAWLKCHYPAFFAAAMLNSQPLGFYAPAQLVRDAREHGVTVLPVDVNASHWDCTLEHDEEQDRETGFALRLGLRQVVGFSKRHADAIVAARTQKTPHDPLLSFSFLGTSSPFSSIDDFSRRTHLPPSAISLLARADAFAALGKNRRQALWDALAQNSQGHARPLFADLPHDDDPPVQLPVLSAMEEVLTDYTTAGLSLKAHPISFYRPALDERGASGSSRLPEIKNGKSVLVAGLVIMRQRPSTAKGITFVTLEDETGTINLVVHQATWDRFHRVARRSPAWMAWGRLERKQGVVHVIVRRLQDLAEFLQKPPEQLRHQKSRDFR